jgi:hypothetical protein
MSVTTSTTTPTGTYALTITGANGTLTGTTDATLVVQAPAAGDYSIAASPSSVTVKQSAIATYIINITRTNAFAGAVAFGPTAVSGLPAGTTWSISPSSTTGNSVTLTVTTQATTPIGSFAFTITSTSGSFTRTANATLVVTQGCFGGDGDC